MVIVGINDAHDSSACIIKDGKLLIAAMEERFQRLKGISSFPAHAIRACFKEVGLSYSDIDHVAIATKKIVPTNIHNIVGTFSVADHHKLNAEYYKPILYDNIKVRLTDLFPHFAPKGDLDYPVEKIPFITTAEIEGNELEDIHEMRIEHTAAFFDIDKSKIGFYDHHACHAYHAYFTNPNNGDRVAVVTSDGGGDSIYEAVYLVENGKFECCHRGRTSLIGKIFASITLLLNMDPNRHPYKVMGLAPYASDYHKTPAREIFLDSLEVDKLGFKRNPEMIDFFTYFKERLAILRFDGIAGGLQDFTEIRLKEWFRNISVETDTKNFAFAGGVANNTKANLALLESDFVESFFVPAGPGDEGLAIGAAAHALSDLLGPEAATDSFKIQKNAYLGPAINNDVLHQFENHEFVEQNYSKSENFTAEEVAKLLEEGRVVALCIGGMEFGARSLGHRSLIADPSNKKALRDLNDLIKKRDFWMPFAPSVLEECFDEYMIKPDGIDSWDDLSTDFMTLCFHTTELGRKHLATAIHPYDFTVRPQMVSRETCPKYYDIISAFRKRTGIGSVLNTSLNIHEKPIVLTPVNIVEEILLDKSVPLDHIVVEDTLFSKTRH